MLELNRLLRVWFQLQEQNYIVERNMTSKKRTSSVEQTIDENLKRAYNDVASEPLPSRFTDLLNQLKSGEVQDGKTTRSDDVDD